jgi:hypothetical protein
MQCVTPDKLTGFFWYVFVYVESIFVVELMLIVRSFRDILDTVLRGGRRLVKTGTSGGVTSMVVMLWDTSGLGRLVVVLSGGG